MSDREISQAVDYGAEIHRSWRRALRPIMMPKGMDSRETKMSFDPSCEFARHIRDGDLGKEIAAIMKKFDWHSQVRVAFVQGDGGAGWSRSKRTISVYSQYIKRFIKQGTTKPADRKD